MLDQSYNPKCWFLAAVLFLVYIYSRKLLFKIIALCFLKMLCYNLQTKWLLNIRFSIIYFKCCSFCLYCICWISSTHFRYSWYFRSYIISWSCQIKLYSIVNQFVKLKYCNRATTSVSNLLLIYGVLPVTFCLYSRNLLALLFILWLPIGLFSFPSWFSSSL